MIWGFFARNFQFNVNFQSGCADIMYYKLTDILEALLSDSLNVPQSLSLLVGPYFKLNEEVQMILMIQYQLQRNIE